MVLKLSPPSRRADEHVHPSTSRHFLERHIRSQMSTLGILVGVRFSTAQQGRTDFCRRVLGWLSSWICPTIQEYCSTGEIYWNKTIINPIPKFLSLVVESWNTETCGVISQSMGILRPCDSTRSRRGKWLSTLGINNITGFTVTCRRSYTIN